MLDKPVIGVYNIHQLTNIVILGHPSYDDGVLDATNSSHCSEVTFMQHVPSKKDGGLN